MSEPPTGWLPGVFRELLHWVDPDARTMTHKFGVTYYARCGSPCLHIPGTQRASADWPACPDCVLLYTDRPEWSDLSWGYGALEHNIAHATHCDPVPEYGTHARCGAWLTAPSPDPRHVAGILACAHCVAILTDPDP